MSKYASGTNMSTIISNEVDEVQQILSRCRLDDEDKKAVIDAMKEMAYQWCSTNASLCAFEEAARSVYGDTAIAEITRAMVRNGVFEQKMAATYPFK